MRDYNKMDLTGTGFEKVRWMKVAKVFYTITNNTSVI
jgi:hypothetical protein